MSVKNRKNPLLEKNRQHKLTIIVYLFIISTFYRFCFIVCIVCFRFFPFTLFLLAKNIRKNNSFPLSLFVPLSLLIPTNVFLV